MSRIGKQPIPLPKGVDISISGDVVNVKGPKGQLQVKILPGITAALEDGALNITRADDEPQSRSFHGLVRALLAQLMWVALLFVLCQLVLRAGVRRLVIQGG